jgi:hypothetical protein
MSRWGRHIVQFEDLPRRDTQPLGVTASHTLGGLGRTRRPPHRCGAGSVSRGQAPESPASVRASSAIDLSASVSGGRLCCAITAFSPSNYAGLIAVWIGTNFDTSWGSTEWYSVGLDSMGERRNAHKINLAGTLLYAIIRRP